METIENEFMDDEVVSMESQLDSKEAEISFADLGLDDKTLAAIEKKGFKQPSPIQALAIPRLLSGESNMIARARTGTGKTAAFGLPIIQKLRETQGEVRALILEPTRELAIQTCTEMQSFTDGKTPRTCVLYGGASYSTQIKDLKRGTEIVVGTPGRIQDHIERKTLDISKIDYFILDEGDEMLDMGFIDDIEAIFEKANPNCRILLFSATMPEPILKIAAKFMGDYEIVEEEGVIDEPLLIEQKFWILKENEKVDALVRLIDIADDFYGVVFTQTKSDADYVCKSLDEKGYEAAALHGDIAQVQREKILARFRSKKTRVLVATDVAARGIDISGLSHVVNYSLPFDGATYVHRIGRTGRAGSQGTAVTFVCPNETRKLMFLQRAVKKASKGEMKEESVPNIDEVLTKKRSRLFTDLKKQLGLHTETLAAPEEKLLIENTKDETPLIENTETPLIDKVPETVLPLEDKSPDTLLEETSTLIKASGMFTKMAEELTQGNNPQDVLAAVLSVMYQDKLSKDRYGRIQSHGSTQDQTRLYIQLGKKDGYNAKAIADFFSKMLHIPGHQVDRIDVASSFSLVSLPKEAAKKALSLSKSNGKVPHIHIDTKDEMAEEPRGRKRRGGRGGEGRSFRKEERPSRDFSSKDKPRSFSKARDSREHTEIKGAKAFKKSNRPNVHTPTERSGSAGLYKKKSGKAERF